MNMKTAVICFFTVICFFIGSFLFSCSSIADIFSVSQSWAIPEGSAAGEVAMQTIKLAGITIDRLGGWDSLEREVIALAPLYFWEHGYRMAEQNADYAAHISLREREFATGWRMRRSLAIEVRIWDGKEGAMPAAELSGKLPIAAGRVVTVGDKSFSSSKTTGRMLALAIGKAIGELPSVRKGS